MPARTLRVTDSQVYVQHDIQFQKLLTRSLQVMKRWNFHGQPASHGVSLTHRSLGSAGGSQGSGSRVLPGKKMAGRMGNERNTIQNLKIMKVDEANGLLVVNGMTPAMFPIGLG